ncbi:MAG: aminopeptidase [Clostridia bacterium]|nr:aminopeptidase [Clostridia bacterium]
MDTKELKSKLFYESKHICNTTEGKVIEKADEFCEPYKDFLQKAKTEREICDLAEIKAKEAGFTEFDKNKSYFPGDKVYLKNRGKSLMLCVFGSNSLENGVKISAAHIDSPRIDLKPSPIYEDSQIALFKTHYYGGIKKYQWTTIPLSLHGKIIREDLSEIDINIGEDKDDPQFVITDLLPHLGQEQMKRKLSEGIKGEELNIVIGSRPLNVDEEETELVKLNILKILNEKYDITEKDFLRAELCLVPAFEVRDIGFDRSMIGGYGHDDRVCAYPALEAILHLENPEYTCITMLADKEEIGSDGNTGMKSLFMYYFIDEIAKENGLSAGEVLSKSTCLSADVNSAFDPTFPDVMEKKNSSYINRGIVITKYTGGGGKSGTSDASAEYMGYVINIFDKNEVRWQTGELGKVDLGGGGTVAKYIANLNVDVVDVGVPVLSMHSPFEVVSKLDVYMAFRGFYEYFKAEK